MSNTLFIAVLSIFILYIIFKILSVYQENKKLNLSLNALKDKNSERAKTFSVTKEIGDLMIDATNHLFKFKGQIQLFSYSELLNFDIRLDNKLLGSAEDSNQLFTILVDSLNDLKEIQRLDLVFYVDGLNEGRYTHQFLYHPIKIESDDYENFIHQVNQTIFQFYLIKSESSQK